MLDYLFKKYFYFSYYGIMKNYELVLLLNPSVQDKDQKEFLASLEKEIQNNIVEKDDIGLLTLAHDLWEKKWNNKFYFVSYYLKADTNISQTISQFLLYNKVAYRYFVFSMDKTEVPLSMEKTQQELQKFIDEWVEKKKGNKMTFFTKPENQKYISWKSLPMLKKYMTRFGDIKPRKYTWNAVSVQKSLRKTIIRAREMWLLEYVK